MKLHRAYKVEIDPNNKQRTALLRHAGAARWAYNWGLRQKIDAYQATGKSPNAIELHRDLNTLKHVPQKEGGVPWMLESSKCAPQEALRDLDKAYANFFRRCKNGASKKGFPRFKSKKRGIGGFRLTGAIRVTPDGRHIQLPRLGLIRLKEIGYLPAPDLEDIRILSASVTEKAGRWFVSLSVEQDVPDLGNPKSGLVIGVDVGISSLAVTSEGEVFENPKALRRAEWRLKCIQRSVSRKQKGSNNRKKACRKLARQHFKVSCIRHNALHQATSAITKQASCVVIEDLNVRGMMKNRKLSKALSDASLSEFHRMLEYKARWQGVTVVKADRFFPSSKTCSSCGHVKQDLTLGDRTYECSEGACGLVIDRDLNAAINLKKLAGSSPVTPPSGGSRACGEDVRPTSAFGSLGAASVKQEPNSGAGSIGASFA